MIILALPLSWNYLFAGLMIIFLIVALIIRLKRSRKNKTFAPDFLEQNQKHIQDMKDLIENDEHSSIQLKESIIKIYPEWIKKLGDMYYHAPKSAHKLLIQARIDQHKKWWIYNPGSISDEKPKLINDCEIISDCFTEPFRSLHDLDDLAFATRLMEIFILKGISKDQASKSIVHKKNHFVNHKKVSGLIQFDIYLPKLPS